MKLIMRAYIIGALCIGGMSAVTINAAAMSPADADDTGSEPMQVDKSATEWSVTDWLPTKLVARVERQEAREYAFKNKGTIEVEVSVGTIRLSTWSKRRVVVHSVVRTRTKEEQEQVNFAIEDTPNRLSVVCTQPKQSIVDITLIVPTQAATQLSILERGELIITAASRKVKAFVQEGNIEIVMSTDGSIDACAEQGSIEVTCQAFSSESALFLRAPQSGIMVTLPELVQAALDARVDLGMIRSEIPITFEPFTTPLTKQTWKQMQRRAKGSLGDGGSPIVLAAHTNITIKCYEP